MNKKKIKEIKEHMYYLDSELYSYQDIDNLKEYAKNLEQENQQLKKQKDDVVEYIKSYNLPEDLGHFGEAPISIRELREILRILGEIDNE